MTWSTAGRMLPSGACAAPEAPPIKMAAAARMVHVSVLMGSFYFTNGFENLGSLNNVRSVRVLRKAISDAFSDVVKFNGPTGIM